MMDQHVRSEVTMGLRSRGVDVLTARDDGSHELEDPALLTRAMMLGRVLFSQDTDLLTEAARRQQASEPFGGVIYAHQLRVSVGRCIDDLELLAKACDPPDLANRVIYLPLR